MEATFLPLGFWFIEHIRSVKSGTIGQCLRTTFLKYTSQYIANIRLVGMFGYELVCIGMVWNTIICWAMLVYVEMYLGILR